MKTRRGYLFSLFLVFSYLGAKRLLFPNTEFPASPIEGMLISALFFLAFAALFGSWRAHRRLHGHPAATSGKEAGIEAVVHLGLGAVSGLLAVYLVATILGLGIDRTAAELSPLMLLVLLTLGLAGFFLRQAYLAFIRAFRKEAA